MVDCTEITFISIGPYSDIKRSSFQNAKKPLENKDDAFY
jgi:hypothetical protein